MKIIFINEKCGFFGGVEQNIADTVIGLKKGKKHACYLIFSEFTSKESESFASLFDDCFQVPFSQYQTAEDKIDFICNKIKPDVLYFHKIGSIKPFLKVLKSIHSVRMVHDHDLCCPRKHKYYLHNHRICNRRVGVRCWVDAAFIKRDRSTRIGFTYHSIPKMIDEMRRNTLISRLLVGSRFMQSELQVNGFPKEKVQILPPVVRKDEQEITTDYPTENRILYVGQLIRGKGVDLLLRALKHVSNDFKATLVGQGNAIEKLKKLTDHLGLSEKVQFTGWIDHHQLQAYYSAAKLIVVPSRWPEPFGMVGLEAMKYKRAVVGFDAGGIRDWLHHQENGLLVPEQNITEFASAIDRLLSHSDLAEKYGINGYHKLQNQFSFEHYLDCLLKQLTV